MRRYEASVELGGGVSEHVVQVSNMQTDAKTLTKRNQDVEEAQGVCTSGDRNKYGLPWLKKVMSPDEGEDSVLNLFRQSHGHAAHQTSR